MTCYAGTAGDFDGDGQDEVFDYIGSGFAVTKLLPNSDYQWSTVTGTQIVSQVNQVAGTFAMNLDDDPADELLVFEDSVSCWKAVSHSPWIWQRRDDLLATLHFPTGTQLAMFGDYDGDGYWNAVYKIVYEDSSGGLAFYERSRSGVWQGSIVDTDIPYNLFDGDFDHDGDLDAAVMWKNPAGATSTVFYENHGGGTVSEHASTLPGGKGGDLDGDGDWEGLFLPQEYGRFLMVEIAPHPVDYLRVTHTTYLGRFAGPIIGRFKTHEGFAIAGGQNHLLPKYPPEYTYFQPMAWSATGWRPLLNGFTASSSLISYAQLADLNGDGLNDILQRQLGFSSANSARSEWWLWENIGSTAADSFSFSPTTAFHVTRFDAQPETTFSNLQIGDVTGDGRAELAALVRVRNQPAQVLFYSLDGSLSGMSFCHLPLADAGIPYGINEFVLSDLDGDGVCEVVARLTGWRVYTGGASEWSFSALQLPAMGAGLPTFADFDNDGDMDVFTAAAVWINTTITAADENFIPHPSSFGLSAYPNPFNPQTTIVFNLEGTDRIQLNIYNLLGRRVVTLLDGVLPPGEYSVAFDGSTLSAGAYFARLESPVRQKTLKLLLLK